jgi:O-antigen/teichoic acid export membrane protein
LGVILSEYKSFVQRIGLVGITNILVTLSTIILLPIITKYFPIQLYGAWVQVIITIGLLSNATTLGLPYTMVRFLSPLKDKKQIQEGFYSITAIVFITSIIISFLIFIFSVPIASVLFNGYDFITKYLSFILIFACLNFLIISYFRTFNQIKKYSIFSIIDSYLSLGLVAYFVISGYGMLGALIGLLINYIILFLIMSSFIVAEIGFTFPKFHNMKEYLSFGLPTVPASLSRWIVESSDRYLIGILLGIAFVGYYSPSYALGKILLIMWAPFAFLLPSVLPRYYDKNDINEVLIYLKYSLKFFLLLAIPCAFGLSILSYAVLMVLTTPEIAVNGYYVTPLVTTSALLLGFYGIFGYVLALEKITKIIGITWAIAAVLNLGLNFIFIPFLGILGAAITTLIAYTFATALTIFYSKKILPLDFDLRFIAKSILASIIMSLFIAFVNPRGIFNILIVVIISIFIYFVLIWLFKGITKEEVEFSKKMFK